jgi:hypothetical protein
MDRARALPLLAATALLFAACGGDAPPESETGAPAEATTATTQDVTYGEDGFIAVGSPAPDFALRGATRFGVLAEPVRLSDFQGKTVVLAFFFRARGRG